MSKYNQPVPLKIYASEVEEEALKQLHNLSKLKIIYPHIAVMPDVHAGKGSTVGSVIPTYNAIIPAAVGVDIGCGMQAVELNIHANDLPESLYTIRREIESNIPVGFNQHKQPVVDSANFNQLKNRFNRKISYEYIKDYSPEKWALQLGTLGGGNHFIELCLDEKNHVWIMLHSGSRGIGNRIGTQFIELAKQAMQDEIHHLPDKDLAYFNKNSKFFNDYLEAVLWAQDYARINRNIMLALVFESIKKFIPDIKMINHIISCHHNYVSLEQHYNKEVYVTRKGAISAKKDEYGIIPGSMGTKSYIVKGKGNPESFMSCSHGAGRRMSRSKANKTFTKEDVLMQTSGVECKKDHSIIDELPGAYKDIDQVMASQKDLVEVAHTLKAILCVKG